MTKYWLALTLIVVLALTRFVSASALSFQVVSGADAKALEQRSNRLIYDTLLWGNTDTVLFLSYGGHDYILNVDARSGTLACRLGF